MNDLGNFNFDSCGVVTSGNSGGHLSRHFIFIYGERR